MRPMEKGTRLGPYEILEQLGAGGMGEVWLAEDARLGRKVAVKVLPEEFAKDPERRARFEREARAAAALNHPHIASVHDIGSEGEVHFIVQEYLEGADLRARLDAGRLPLVTALGLVAEVAEALAVAHAAGIAHRDLKPENIFVVEQGHAKILDFGLAKLTEKAAGRSSTATQSPTVLATSAGQMMGTAGYMAPEQITGEDVDERADLFAFGCVLYESVSGKRAFAGKNLPEVLHRLANEEPIALREADPALPTELSRITSKCLVKAAARRYQGAADLAVDLRQLISDIESGRAEETAPAPQAPRHTNSRVIAAAGLAGLLAGALMYWLVGATAASAGAAGEPLYLPLRSVPGLAAASYSQMALSSDSRHLAFATGSGPAVLWDLRDVGAALEIPETDGAQSPFFSPDGHWLGYVGADNRLYRVPVEGGRPQPFTERLRRDTLSVEWRESGDFIVSTTFEAPAMQIPAIGGAVEPLLEVDRAGGEVGQGTVSFLPDGDHALYAFWDDRWRVAVRSLARGERTILTDGFGARYVPTGHLIWILSQQLMGARFDPATLKLGEPVQLIGNIAANPGWGRPSYAFNAAGTLAYLQAPEDRGTAILRLDANRGRTIIRPADEELTALAISPDRRRLGLTVRTVDGDSQIWSYDMERADLLPIAQGAGWDQYPFFLGPGAELAYVSERDGGGDIYARSADGVGAERPLTATRPYRNDPHGTRSGDVAAQIADPDTGSDDIWVYAADDLEAGTPFAASEGSEAEPRFSPDARFLAYASNRSGRYEVYVAPYPQGPGTHEWKVTTEGGRAPRWTGDGRFVFYLADGRIWRTPVTQTDPFRTGSPELFAQYGGDAVGWDVAADGSHVIAIDELESPRPQLLLNWFTELERRLPAR